MPWSERISLFCPQNDTNQATDSCLSPKLGPLASVVVESIWWQFKPLTNPSLRFLGRQLRFGHGFILQLWAARCKRSTEPTESGAGRAGHNPSVLGTRGATGLLRQSRLMPSVPSSLHLLLHYPSGLGMNYRDTGREVPSQSQALFEGIDVHQPLCLGRRKCLSLGGSGRVETKGPRLGSSLPSGATD